MKEDLLNQIAHDADHHVCNPADRLNILVQVEIARALGSIAESLKNQVKSSITHDPNTFTYPCFTKLDILGIKNAFDIKMPGQMSIEELNREDD